MLHLLLTKVYYVFFYHHHQHEEWKWNLFYLQFFCLFAFCCVLVHLFLNLYFFKNLKKKIFTCFYHHHIKEKIIFDFFYQVLLHLYILLLLLLISSAITDSTPWRYCVFELVLTECDMSLMRLSYLKAKLLISLGFCFGHFPLSILGWIKIKS